MNKKLLVFAFLPLLFITSTAYAETPQNMMYARQNVGSESSKQNFGKTNGEFKNMMMQKMDLKNNPKFAEFKAKISQISDARKKQVAERIDLNITNLNTKSTTSLNNSLTRLTEVLNNIKTKQSTIATTGANLVPLSTAISNAETAINNAKAAVTTQSQKQYTADIPNASNSATLRSPFSQMLLQFKQDIMNTRQSVLSAKEAVVKAAIELNKLMGSPTPPATGTSAAMFR